MDAETIDFCGKSYVVVKRLYKSWGSQRQTMTETPDHRTDCHKSYHIVSLGEEKFWLKTWIVPDAPHRTDSRSGLFGLSVLRGTVF